MLHETMAAARARLVAGGIRPEEAAIDVDVYVREILGWDQSRLLTSLREPAPPGLEPRFSEWIARREKREPTAYIIGHREFWGIDFKVTPSVLVPRPESELIVEEALARLRTIEAPRFLDVGTGSGCIGIAIATELPRATGVATDISGEALVVARENARRLGVAGRMEYVETSYLDGIEGLYDAVVSNPPYVKEQDRLAVDRAVVRFEPHVALFGGDDGMSGVTAVLEGAVDRVRPGGWVIFEFGLGQDDEIAALVRSHPAYDLEAMRSDLQGIPRTAIARRV